MQTTSKKIIIIGGGIGGAATALALHRAGFNFMSQEVSRFTGEMNGDKPITVR
ncbi:hypothetical protein HC931_01645 [Candidatus Gracilibacteria bacterium]|nr:hypothetical protein [Candidatus Gracilibacteria bacterium]